MDVIADLSPLSPGLIDELEAFMAPGGEGCPFPPQEPRRIGGHQLPDSPPDSGSENPYSPSEPHTITVTQSVLGPDYMLVHDMPTHDMIQQNGDYIYEELKPDAIDHEVLRSVNDVVVLPQDGNLVDLGLRSVRHEMLDSLGYPRYGMRVEMADLEPGIMNPQMVGLGHEPLTPVYTSLQEPNVKKRKHSQDVNSLVKCEPVLSPESLSPQQGIAPRPAPSVDGSEAGDDAPFQCIRFGVFQQSGWHTLCDQNLKALTPPSYVVGADKGFNFSQIDEAFVCQKKNHFQVTCQMQMAAEPHYVKTADGFKKISQFFLHFYGVKAEDPNQEVRVEQSQSDRTKKPFHPVPVELRREGTKVTVGRLHFAETTNNNMRKKGRPNPDQRHFQLVVSLRAHCQGGDYMIAANASDRIIVRASNPGQFESDCTENWWQRGASENSVHFNGRVGINTDRPDESCVINGNLKVMGHIVHPSDARAKHNIEELDTAQQLKNVQSIRVVKFNYDPSFAQHSGLLGCDPASRSPPHDTGVIAQELRRVLPEAVREAGDLTLPNGDTIHKFLVVNKDRIFMENLGAVKELGKVTGRLETRIHRLERASRLCGGLRGLRRVGSDRSTDSHDSRYSGASNSSKSLYSDGNISIEQIRDIARNIRRHECCHKLSHNSPKYTRKQCKSCRENSTFTKYGKYYNYNKTSGVKYGRNEQKHDCGNTYDVPYVDSVDAIKPELPDESHYSTLTKKDTCLWVKNSDSDGFECGNTRIGFCCKRTKLYGDTELISNKLLQIVITVLVFVMAVCLVVMSALYFREHQELVRIKGDRYQERPGHYNGYGKFGNVNPQTAYRHTTVAENVHLNQIQNSKHLHNAAVKKTPKEKGPHKSTAAPPRSPPPPSPTPSGTNVDQRTLEKQMLALDGGWSWPGRSRSALAVGGGCARDNALNADIDMDCQTSCSLYAQSFDNQEPLEKNSAQEKDLNDTKNFARPLEPLAKSKQPIIPVMPEKNASSKLDNDSMKSQLLLHEDIAESNLNLINGTENETKRLKRGVKDDSMTKQGKAQKSAPSRRTQKYSEVDRRRKRDANEAYSPLGSETDEMVLEQSDEIAGLQDTDNITFGIKSKTFANETIFEEVVYSNSFYNISYMVPVSKCLKDKYIDIYFKSKKLKQFLVCSLKCKYESVKSCRHARSLATPRPLEEGDGWRSRAALDCNTDTHVVIRASFNAVNDLCYLSQDQKLTYIEYNIRLYRDCHN